MSKYQCGSCHDTGHVNVRGSGPGGWVKVPCQACERGGRLMWVCDGWLGVRQVRAVERMPGFWTYKPYGPSCYSTARDALLAALMSAQARCEQAQAAVTRLTALLETCADE